MSRSKRFSVTLSTGFFFSLIAFFLMSEWTPIPIFKIVPVSRIFTHTIRTSLRTLSNFGRTHFIVGYEETSLPNGYDQQRTIKNPTEIKKCDGVYFSPNDQLCSLLVDYIKKETESIKIAVYLFTDGTIADALVEAHKRGIKITVLVDPGCLRDTYNKIGKLIESDIPVYVYDAQNHAGGLSSLMHHKFVLFGCNRDKKKLTWTGSFNFTQAATKRNHENAIILCDEKAYDRFDHRFNVIITEESHRYGASKLEKSQTKKDKAR